MRFEKRTRFESNTPFAKRKAPPVCGNRTALLNFNLLLQPVDFYRCRRALRGGTAIFGGFLTCNLPSPLLRSEDIPLLTRTGLDFYISPSTYYRKKTTTHASELLPQLVRRGHGGSCPLVGLSCSPNTRIVAKQGPNAAFWRDRRMKDLAGGMRPPTIDLRENAQRNHPQHPPREQTRLFPTRLTDRVY